MSVRRVAGAVTRVCSEMCIRPMNHVLRRLVRSLPWLEAMVGAYGYSGILLPAVANPVRWARSGMVAGYTCIVWVRLPGDSLMSSPRDRGPDLRLERLDNRDGRRPAHLGEAAMVASPLAGESSTRKSLAAYEALIDAVFMAPGALEWLSGLRRAVAAMLADKNAVPRVPVAQDAIHAAPVSSVP
jgi:hypothetical protein